MHAHPLHEAKSKSEASLRSIHVLCERTAKALAIIITTRHIMFYGEIWNIIYIHIIFVSEMVRFVTFN